jgi:hypothetical protein
MPANVTTTAPTIEIIGDDAEPSDSAISALARLLLSVADHDDTTTNKETVASVT